MLDFNKYDDIIEIKGYDGFIDRNGSFYKICSKNRKIMDDSHNDWAEQFIKEKINMKDLKLNQTVSMLFTLASLNGPAEILVNCFGYVYYSHDPIYYKPIIKTPNPKISGYKITEEQLNMLYMIMTCNRENTDISIFFDDCDDYEYSGLDEYTKSKKI